MDIVGSLGRYCRFPYILIASGCLVIVAQLEAGFRRERQYLSNGAIELSCIAAREIGTGCAVVRHEERIPDESCIADDIGHAGRRVAGGVHGVSFDRAELERVAILEEAIELAAVALELGAGIEDLSEGVLNEGNLLADAKPSPELLLY